MHMMNHAACSCWLVVHAVLPAYCCCLCCCSCYRCCRLPQVNFLSHWLLAHELLSEQRKRRAKAAKKNHSSSSSKPNRKSSSSSSTALTTASISGSSMQSSKAAAAAADAAACCSLEGTRLVMLSSLTHHAGSLQWGDKQSANGYNPFTSYALSKICNIIMAKEFQRRFDRCDGCAAGSSSSSS